MTWASPCIVSSNPPSGEETTNLLKHHTANPIPSLVFPSPSIFWLLCNILTQSHLHLSGPYLQSHIARQVVSTTLIQPRCGSVVLTLDSQPRVILRDLLAILRDEPNFTQLQREAIGEESEELRELGCSERSEGRSEAWVEEMNGEERMRME